ncbi:MAG: phosphomannomutase/phosphoglucomutase [Rickettsiales bacterium]
MVKLNKNIVREYDIRGVFGQELFAENAYEIGLALGLRALANNSDIINIGYDGRNSSPILVENLIAGIKNSGCAVNNIGLVPSPMLYFSVYWLKVDYGIMVTASHNPKEYNGFKIISKKENFYGSDLKKFADFVNLTKKYTHTAKYFDRTIEIENAYLTKLCAELAEFDISNLKIAWDPACGASAAILNKLLEKLPNKNFVINNVIDGDFPAHDPDPTIEKNLTQLKQLLKNNNCDLAIAFDGDGDRLGVLDNEAEVIWGDQLITLFAKDVLSDLPESTIITDIKASSVFKRKIEEYKGKALIWKTGHSLIKAKMKEEGSPLAGEMSGHVFFADKNNYGYDDGLYAAIRLIAIIAKYKINLADYRKSLPLTYTSKEEKIAVKEQEKFRIIEIIKAILQKEQIDFLAIDGVRVSAEEGWWLIRASNTSPYLTTRCEANSQEGLAKLQNKINQYVKKASELVETVS